MSAHIAIAGFTRDRHQLFFQHRANDLTFTTSLWYHDCDLVELEERFGEEVLQRIYFHIGAFEINKLASLAPQTVSFGPFAPFVTADFVDLWSTITRNVWAQWRFENDLPDTMPPRVIDPIVEGGAPPIEVPEGERSFLAFCGGGKDSLVAARLLEAADVEYESFVYASSIYGNLDAQHAIIDRLIEHLAPSAVRRVSIFDDFLDSPVLQLDPELGVHTLTAAETPSSIFEALPLVLQHGTRHLVLGHERSADVGNLVWDRTGEEVNHQWGKSTEAELLLAGYVREHLISSCSFFSILKPINDVVIFSLLAQEAPDAIAATHSCNVSKPWCRRCPKCVYVWLSYLAYLDEDLVTAMFGEDLFEVEENREDLLMMAGLGAHTPFECIGQIEETRLALQRCRAKGMTGRLLDLIPPLDPAEVARSAARFTQVDASYPGLPPEIRDVVLDRQLAAAQRAAALFAQPG